MFACSIFLSCTSPDPNWWKYQGNLYNWGQAQSKGSMGNATHVRLRGNFCGGPVFWPKKTDSRIIMSLGDGTMGSIVPLQGMVSSVSIGVEATSRCAAVPLNNERDPSIYVGTNNNHLIAFNEDLTIIKWNKQLDDFTTAILGSPTVYNGIVFITSDNKLFARDEATGNPLWQYKATGDFVYYAPPIAIENDAFIYVATFAGEITKFKVASVQTPIWTKPSLGYRITGHIMVDSHFLVYVPGDDGKMHVLDPATGNEQWTLDTGSPRLPTGASLSFDGDIIYFADNEKQFHAFDRTTHQRLWYKDLTAIASTPPIVAPGATKEAPETIYLGIGWGPADSKVIAFNKDVDIWPAVGGLRGAPNAMAVDQNGVLYAVAGNELIIIK